MTDPRTAEQLDHWVLAYLDDSLDQEQFAHLCQAMRDDAAALDRFVELACLDRSLLDAFTHDEQVDAMHRASQVQFDPSLSFEATLALLNRGSESAELVHLHPDLRSRPRVMPYLIGGSIAAVLALVVTLTLVFAGESTPPQNTASSSEPSASEPTAPATETPVATLTGTRDAEWLGPDPQVGDTFEPGRRLELIAGFAEITTHKGAVAILEAPATVELLDNENALRLIAGKLVGICETESSKGFLVRTDQMDITDLGTRFGVEVVRGLSTEVHVHQGEVTVAVPRTKGGFSPPSRSVVANQAVRADAVSDQLSRISPSFEKFDASLRTVRLPGSGVGLAEGTVVPNWQIIEDANGPLDFAPVLIVKHSKSEQYPHFEAPDNDPVRAQWLFYGHGNTAYYPFDPIPGLDPTRLLIDGRVNIPASVDLADKELYLRYGYNEELNSLHINGRPVELPSFIAGPDRPLFYEIEMPIVQTALRHGENVVLVDLKNRFTSHLASFYFYWEVRPATALTPNTGENQP